MAPGERVGQFRIVRLLGVGGMGTVFLAEQDSPRRLVALKIVRSDCASPAVTKRFAAESQVLGRLQHSGIAQVYQAGTLKIGQFEQPYFAMEYVRGEALSDYLKTHAVGERGRLEIFIKICDAVQHAHAKGVIHRDLKPANILVEENATPRILDFGVARLTDADMQAATMQTDMGQLVGTLPYMSPEQVAANPFELDSRSDVYALGVVLFEMLSGRLPYELSKRVVHEAVRIIREQEPTRLSVITRTHRGDLETIVSKALEKDRSRRYQTAAELAGDVRRYLADEPIMARPASAMYQLRKFARRNRPLVAGALAVVGTLALGTVASTTMWLRAVSAERQANLRAEEAASALVAAESARVLAGSERDAANSAREAANRERATAEAIAAFLQEVFSNADRKGQPDPRLTVRDALVVAVERADAQFAKMPSVHATLLHTAGKAYYSLGLWEQSSSVLRRALDLRRAEFKGDHPLLVSTLADLGFALLSDFAVKPGLFGQGRERYGEAIEMQTRLTGAGSPEVAAMRGNLSQIDRLLDRDEDIPENATLSNADRSFLAAASIAIGGRKSVDELHADIIRIRNTSVEKLKQGDTSGAVAIPLEYLKLWEEVPFVSKNLPAVCYLLGQRQESQRDDAFAEVCYRTACQMLVGRGLEGDSWNAMFSAGLAQLLLRTGRRGEAMVFAETAVEVAGERLGEDHQEHRKIRLLWAVALVMNGRGEEAASIIARDAPDPAVAPVGRSLKIELFRFAIAQAQARGAIEEVAKLRGQLDILEAEKPDRRP